MLTLTQSPAILFSYSHSSVNGFFKQNQSPLLPSPLLPSYLPQNLIFHITECRQPWLLLDHFSFSLFFLAAQLPLLSLLFLLVALSKWLFWLPGRMVVSLTGMGGNGKINGWVWTARYWEGGMEEYLGWTKLHVNVSPAWRTLGSPSLLGTPPPTPPVFFCFLIRAWAWIQLLNEPELLCPQIPAEIIRRRCK